MKLGEFLRNERIKKGIDIETAAEETRVKDVYIRAIEDENWDLIPGEIYQRHYLKTYLEYLGDPEDVRVALGDNSIHACLERLAFEALYVKPDRPPPLYLVEETELVRVTTGFGIGEQPRAHEVADLRVGEVHEEAFLFLNAV